MKYLKQFIVGSSIPVVFLFYYGFKRLKKDDDLYFKYSFMAPLWFGIFNVISLYIAETYKLSMNMRFLLISIISYLLIISFNKYNQVYNFTNKEWIQYYIGMLVVYLFTWNIIIYQIEKRIS